MQVIAKLWHDHLCVVARPLSVSIGYRPFSSSDFFHKYYLLHIVSCYFLFLVKPRNLFLFSFKFDLKSHHQVFTKPAFR